MPLHLLHYYSMHKLRLQLHLFQQLMLNHRFHHYKKHLSYYSKVPKEFKNTLSKSSDLKDAKPKAMLKLSKITAIATMTQDEASKGNKKLKGQLEQPCPSQEQ